MRTNHYDYIIAGAGLAGLSFAYYLVEAGLDTERVLLVDRSIKSENDRTWCFWAKDEMAFSHLVSHRWDHLHFFGPDVHREASIAPYSYQQIRGIDFYEYVKPLVLEHPQIEWLSANIEHVGEDQEGAFIHTGEEIIRAKWVLDSTHRMNPQRVREQQYHWQWQHFRGWFIETKQAQFHSNQATLMDFRVPQKNDARFLYVLPFSEHQALVEFTGFSNEFYTEQEYEEVLEHYIVQQLGITDFEVSERESGAIPMTDWSVDRHPSPHVIRIGTAGGQVKPTTGYAFWNIQQDCQVMAESLLWSKQPAFRPATSARYRFYDRLLLNILQEKGHRAQGIFTALFKHNQMRRILRFMGESTQIWEEALLFSKLPWAPFFRAIANTHPLMKRWQALTKSRQYPVKI